MSEQQAIVSLREVTEKTVKEVCRLKVSEVQNKFVAPNAFSIAQAYFSKYAWFRAIYADETPVGFLMIHDEPEKAKYFLWRFMIATEYQGEGFGKQAIKLLIEHIKTRPNAKEFFTSYSLGEGSPEMFYRKLGFEPNGEMDEDEVVAVIKL